MNRDLFNNTYSDTVAVNIYADEIISKRCPFTDNRWHYMGIIVEDLSKPLLPDILAERFCNNFEENSPYYKKNNRPLHWVDLSSADEKNICKRWFNYILTPSKSYNKFYFYLLGLNDTFLNSEEFDPASSFNSKYNRFFRSSILYSLKCFFGSKQILIKNIYHEQGQQQKHQYFPWHLINKLQKGPENIFFDTNTIKFLEKDHTIVPEANIIQLCDCVMGAITNIIHGVEESNRGKYRTELLDLLLPLVERMTAQSDNKNSSYKHCKRIMLSFFPKNKSGLGDTERDINQFYTRRRLKYVEDKNGQGNLF